MRLEMGIGTAFFPLILCRFLGSCSEKRVLLIPPVFFSLFVSPWFFQGGSLCLAERGGGILERVLTMSLCVCTTTGKNLAKEFSCKSIPLKLK